jgi:hypothetical protein
VDHPDWGHGPNPPVLTFTELEIRAVMKHHRPAGGTQYCWCSWVNGTFTTAKCCLFNVDHLIDMLKAARD